MLRVSHDAMPVTVAPREHSAFAWLPWREAARKCFSWSNRDAILMVAAALISLVSLDRLAGWVAMVIIAREFAVSGLRIAAGQQGVVIPASGLGKVKTIVQVVAVLALIAAHDPNAAWVLGLVYLMVAITLASGADYFLNFRRTVSAATAARQR